MRDWRIIAGAEGYEVNEVGEIRNVNSGRILKTHVLRSGHVTVGVTSDEGERVKRYVSHLVATAFQIPHPPRYDTTIHLDGDLENCDATNLQWRPRWFALKYTYQFRTLRGYRTLPIRNVDTGEIYLDVWDLIIQQGLLLNDIKRSINECTVAWPTMHRYEWIQKKV